MKPVPFPEREQPYVVDSKGILDSKTLPDADFNALWVQSLLSQP